MKIKITWQLSKDPIEFKRTIKFNATGQASEIHYVIGKERLLKIDPTVRKNILRKLGITLKELKGY